MGACSVDKRDRIKFLKNCGFKLENKRGKGGHSIWRHKETGSTIALCQNPAKGTWLKIEKQARSEKMDAKRKRTAPRNVQPAIASKKRMRLAY